MLCPKCVHEMETVSAEGIEIDRCAHCFGIWFDRLEKEDLRKLKGAESVDVGDEFVGARYDQIQQIDCPKCGTPALHVNVQEPTIRFEKCPTCGGSFFDAGEFRDYLEEEIIEQFQALLTD